jgi:hypothetical protein
MKRRLAALFLLALSGGFAIPPARATEGSVSLYVPGLRSTLGGVVAPPGFYFENTAVLRTIDYNLLIAQTSVSTRVKVLREVETENRFRDTIGLFTVSFPLGGQAPPNQAPAVTAKY